jgi:hypothetical protein
MIRRCMACLLAVACFAGEPKADQLYGRWKVVSVAGSSPITAMSGAAMAHLIGKFLVLSPRETRFAGRRCRSTYDVSNETAAEFAGDYKVDAKTLSLNEPLTRVDGGCTDIFVHAPDKIIFTWKGFFLDATKVLGK